MTAGVQFFSKGKTLQLTNEYPPMSLRRSGRLRQSDFVYQSAKLGETLGAGSAQGEANYTAGIDLSGYSCAMVFFKANALTARVTALISPDGKLFFGKWWNFIIPADAYIEYFIFDQWVPPERSTRGMQLFKRGFGITYDSAWHTMQILQIHKIPPENPYLEWGSNYAYEIDTGITSGNFAVGLSTYRSIWIDAGTGGSGGVNNAVGWILRDCTWNEGQWAKISYVIEELDFTNYGAQSSRHYYSRPTYLYVIDTSRLPVGYGV